MTVDLVIRCEGVRYGSPCRNAYTAEHATLAAQARREAAGAGWTSPAAADRCPACTTRAAHPLLHDDRRETADVLETALGIPVVPAPPLPGALHPADDPTRCGVCGRTLDQHNVRHPFRRPTYGRPRQEPRP